MRTTESEGDKLEMPSDDDENTFPSQDSADIRNVDIREEQSENTQREDWLLPMEPRHGARPRQTGGEHPPAMEDSVLRDVADVSAVRHPYGGTDQIKGTVFQVWLQIIAGRLQHGRGYFSITMGRYRGSSGCFSGRRRDSA